MAQPRTYTRQFNFNDFQTTSPADPLPGTQVDTELNTVKLTLDDLNTNIAKIQQDDGKIKNQSVHKDSFDAGALALMSTGSYSIQGNWTASRAYAVNDLVDNNGATYIATSAHTSSLAFETDLTANKWILIANAGIANTASTVDKFEGTGSQTAFTLSSSYTSNTDVMVFVNGALKNPGDDFSISTNTITFVTAPSTPAVSGNENVIVFGASVVAQAAKEAAQLAQTNASGFADEADNWARKTTGLVESADYSSKAYAIGGTGVDNGSGSAKDWATKTSGTVGNTGEYSAKYYATNANVGTVATNIADINNLASVSTEIGALGTSTNITNMSNLNATGVIANINTTAGISSDISTVAGISGGVTSLVASLEKTYVVTVASVGGVNVFVLDGNNNPAIGMFRGNKYIFDLSDSSVSGHPLAFKDGSGNSWTSGVTTTGTPGTSGAKVEFEVPSTAPNSMRYYCTVHGNAMGNTITVTDSNLSLVAGLANDITTVAGQITPTNNIQSVATFAADAFTRTFNMSITSPGLQQIYNVSINGNTKLDLTDQIYKGFTYIFDFSGSLNSIINTFEIMDASTSGQGTAIGAAEGFTITGTFGQAGCQAVWKVPQTGTGGTYDGNLAGRYRINGDDSSGNVLTILEDPYQRLATGATISDINQLGTTAVINDMQALTASGVLSNIANVNANLAAINGVNSDLTTINAVNNIASDISNVQANGAAISNVNTSLSTINAVNNNSTNINAVNNNSTNINSVAGNATNINTVANNIGDVNSFVEKYRVSPTQPTSSLDNGDLWYDEGNDLLKIYNTNTSSFIAVQQAVDYTAITSTYTKAQIASTFTGTITSISGVLDFDTYNNFFITLATNNNSNVLNNPTTESGNVGQTGVICFQQPSSGSTGSISLGSDYETSLGAGLSLTAEYGVIDVVPYLIFAEGRILLGIPQRNFS